MPRKRSPGYYVIALFCILGCVALLQRAFGLLWLALLLTIPLALLLLAPPSVLHRLGLMAGNVKRAFRRRRQPFVQDMYSEEQSYEQGYQANLHDPVQQQPILQDSFETPQAHYPQQLPPMRGE
ncbi:hypothetical protein EPA93_24480 [Ktedonosporobacter rubrisoli]|uniref:Uncharacterized protein n=1 Tax=Ktedonosporobacter rubrisoli TaxID=2509675 RepID=A0A4P6JTR3_KTERU|nr:hypothetical protein [Ktedonosporobacter rubrisoli]QBD78967.1 hypothetical protein EPA93_24480 [Ktedonosporobacter rubrisoli]